MRALPLPWLLAVVLVVLGSHPAAPQPASSSNSSSSSSSRRYMCADAHLSATADRACDRTCRHRIGNALVILYQGLSGRPDAGPWRLMAADSMCASDCAFNGTHLPSYCCWPGVFCCAEFASGIGRGSGGNRSAADVAAAACGRVAATVQELAMRDFGLAGRLADARVLASLALLTSYGLHAFDLSSNSIGGTIPAALGGLANITTININNNHLSGTLPPQLGRLPKLQHFHASFNRLTGSVGGCFCSLPDAPLAILSLRANRLNGSVSFGKCMQLRVLDVQDNRLSGALPVDGRNQQLISIRASNNLFNGSISEDIWRLPELTTIDASSNDLTGSISPYCGSSNNLIQVLLGNNSLHGSVPGNLTSNSQLLVLSLSDNPGIMGTMPNSKSMVGLRNLDLHNTAISGTIPEVWGNLPYLEAVDISNTRMSCCASQAEADARAARGVNSLVPPFLEFGGLLRQFDITSNQEEQEGSPTDAGDVLCGTVTRRQQPPSVWNVFNLPVTNDAVATQRWTVGPLYSWFKNCTCPPGYRQDGTVLFQPAQAWCGSAATSPDAPPSSCVDMHIPRCVAAGPPELSAGAKAGITVAVAIAALLLLLAANKSLARASKLRRYYVRAKTRLAGAPKHGRLSLVVTDIESYSDIFKRSPEVMFRALLLHNAVIRAAKYDNCGFVLEQEGDSFTLAFYDAFDAAAFCLQVQQALLTVHWPAGLDHEAPELNNSIVSRKPSKLQLRLSSLLASGPGTRKKQMRSAASTTLSEGEPCHLGAMPSGLLAAPSRLTLFSGKTTATSVGGGAEPPLFAGLRVRMGVVTGDVPSGTPIKSSALFQLAKVVSDFGNGGQVLVDHTTFAAIKEDLRVLGAVEAGGLNHSKLASGRGLWAAAKALLGCASGAPAEEACVIDMGAYVTGMADGGELPYATGDHELAGEGDDDGRHTPDWGCGGGPLAWLRRWQHSSSDGGASSFSGSDAMHDGCIVGDRASGGAAGSRSSSSLRSLSRLLSPCSGGGSATQPEPAADAGAAHQLQQQEPAPRVASTTSSAASRGVGAAAVPASSSGVAGPLSFTAGLTALTRQLSIPSRSFGRPASLQRSGTSSRRREWDSVRLFQVLPPALAQRAHVWHNNLSIPAGWCCWDTPYFDAPGSTVVPLATSSSDSLLQGSSTALLSRSASTRAGGLGMRASSGASSLDREPPGPLPSRAASMFAPQLLGGVPLPPVTMVFMGVDHCDSLVKRRRSFAPKVAGLLGRVVRDALRRTGGYLCRVQEGDLKFMVAFGSPVSALEWCLVVQEAAMFLPWPSESVLLYDGCTVERDAHGRVVLRGPRIKMGVCEGVPKSILPDHEGRADFHGPSINMAARYMGQAAAGGQIACSLDLAERVLAYWARCASGGSAAGGGGGGRASAGGGGSSHGGTGVQQQQPELLEQQSQPLQEQQQQQQACEQEAQTAEPSFSSGIVQAEQQPQHGNANSSNPGVPPSALQLLQLQRIGGEADCSSGGGSLFDAPARCSSSGGNGLAGLPAWQGRGQQGGHHAARRQNPQQLDSIDSSGSNHAPEAPQQQQQQTQWSPRAGAQQRTSNSGNLHQQQAPLTRLQLARPSQQGLAHAGTGTASGVVPPTPPTSKFVMASVPLSPAVVEVHRLGLYTFKGGPPQQEMVQVLLSHLAGRLAISDRAGAGAAAPSRKGQQLHKLEGRVGEPVAVQLPALAAEYRAKLPDRALADSSAARRLALQRSHTSLTQRREQLALAAAAPPHALRQASSFSDARGSAATYAPRLALAPLLLQHGAPTGGVHCFSGDAAAEPAGGSSGDGGGGGGGGARQRAMSDPCSGSDSHAADAAAAAPAGGGGECASITAAADAPPPSRAKQQQGRAAPGGDGGASALLRHDSFGSVASGELDGAAGPGRVKSGPSGPAPGVALLGRLQDAAAPARTSE